MNLNKATSLRLDDIRDLLHAEVFVGHDKLHMPVKAGTASDLMSDMLTGYNEGVVLLTGLCNIQVIRTCVIAGVAAVVLVRGKQPNEEMVNQSLKHALPLLSSPFTMYTSCGRLFAKGLRGVEEKVPTSVHSRK